jgi:hypothetical protein
MKILIFLSFLVVFVSAQPEDAILSEFSRKFRVSKNSLEFQNVIQSFKSIKEHNSRFAAGLESFNKSLNELSLLTKEEIAKFKLGALADDPNEVKSRVNLTFFGRQGRAIRPPKICLA